jgi:polysaccharide deacetylase family protein (PEP-CTERM system associated)
MPPTVTRLRTGGRAPRVQTIDVEDWVHVCGDDYFSDPRRWARFPSRVEITIRRVFDSLAGGRHRATFFFLGWIARRHPDLVAEAVSRGHEIGVHGDLHRRADDLGPLEFRDDLLRARDGIEAAAGQRPSVHRAAEWSIRSPGDPALRVLAREGFACDASMTRVPPLGETDNEPGPHRIAFLEASIVELPPLTGRGFGRNLPFGGGGPFRMFSAKHVRGVEEGFRRAGWPAVLSFLPWEFDPNHPPMEGLPPLTRLVHFYGLTRALDRFERWLDPGDPCVAVGDALRDLAA